MSARFLGWEFRKLPVRPVRDPAPIQGQELRCGCGSGAISYIEGVIITRRDLLVDTDGTLLIGGNDLTFDDEGEDPRLECRACRKEYELPDRVDFA